MKLSLTLPKIKVSIFLISRSQIEPFHSVTNDKIDLDQIKITGYFHPPDKRDSI
jgi:hypothetical protein